LETEVGMIPSGSILSGSEFVGQAVAGGNWTLCYTWNTVVFSRVQLTNTVPMNGSSIKLEVVRDMNDEVVSPVSDDGWTGNGAVESKSETRVSIWRNCSVFNRQPVLLSLLDSIRVMIC
jgi:hypothetical protein